MAAVLGPNQYGKAETRVVRVARATDRHTITDLNVGIALTGDLADTHLTGDNTKVLPTDSQKNTVFAFARDGIDEVESFALRLARHFVTGQDSIHTATVAVEEYAWTRVGDHSFTRAAGGEVRTARAAFDGDTAVVEAGLSELLLLNTTDSQFHGFIKDEFTTLPETRDRILATAVSATWRYHPADLEFAPAYATARQALIDAFADTFSLSLQQTLYAMGERVLAQVPEIDEVRLSLPNKHHFAVDLTPFELDNPGVVFIAADRPYGLIEGTVTRA